MSAVLAAGAGATGLFVFLAILAAFGVGALVVRSRIRKFSRSVFGTDSIVEGLNRQADEAASTPKSVSGMTRLMEPQIKRDFPDFVWEEFKHRAENMLTSTFVAISGEDASLLQDASEEVRRQVINRINENREAGVKESFFDVRIHRTEIANYKKSGGACVITIQSALEYYYCKLAGESVVEGSRERKRQTKYNIELMYIQDAGAVSGSAASITCPHCGAPVCALGHFVCEYCGSEVTPVNIRVWALHKYYEV